MNTVHLVINLSIFPIQTQIYVLNLTLNKHIILKIVCERIGKKCVFYKWVKKHKPKSHASAISLLLTPWYIHLWWSKKNIYINVDGILLTSIQWYGKCANTYLIMSYRVTKINERDNNYKKYRKCPTGQFFQPLKPINFIIR